MVEKSGRAEERLKISVCIVCYNQEKYIRQCIESVLSQETSFDVEIIVGDDASTDDTPNIIKSIQGEHPGKIKAIYRKENVGASENCLSLYREATGKYIAHLDGDDYFLPGKLQCQVEFMEKNPKCTVSFHRVKVLSPEGQLRDDYIDLAAIPKGGYTRSDVIQLVAVGINSSKMFRREGMVIPKVDFPVMDYLFNVYQLRDGVAMFAGDKPLGVYRAGVGIASSGLETRKLLSRSLLNILGNWPDEARYVCAASFLLMLADIKNGRQTWFNYFRCFVFSFRFAFVREICRRLSLVRMLRLPI